MWKIVLVLLTVSALMLTIRILYDPPVIETRAGMVEAPALGPMQSMQSIPAYVGFRG
jgi:hypothetical protein